MFNFSLARPALKLGGPEIQFRDLFKFELGCDKQQCIVICFLSESINILRNKNLCFYGPIYIQSSNFKNAYVRKYLEELKTIIPVSLGRATLVFFFFLSFLH